jgi:hypothetical protein
LSDNLICSIGVSFYEIENDDEYFKILLSLDSVSMQMTNEELAEMLMMTANSLIEGMFLPEEPCTPERKFKLIKGGKIDGEEVK